VILYRTCSFLALPQTTALSAIPKDAVFILKGTKTNYILDLNREYKNFFPILFSPASSDKINYLFDTLFSKKQYSPFLKNSSLYLALFFDKEEELLVAIETSKRYNDALLAFSDSVCLHYGGKSFVYKNNTVYLLQTGTEKLYLHCQNGLLLFTFNEKRMRLAINQLVLKANNLQSIINSFPNSRNEDAKMYICIQHPRFTPYLNNKIRQAGGDINITDLLKPFQWSILDIETKKQDIRLSGYTTVDTSIASAKLLMHNNNKVDFLSLLPLHANRIFSLKAKQAKDFTDIKPIVYPNEDFFSLMYPNHIITFETENDTMVFNYLLIHSENTSEASFHLFNSLNSYFDMNHYVLDTFYISSYLVGRVCLPNFVLIQLGIDYQLAQLNYYAVIHDYIIFADTKEAITDYVTKIRNNQTFKTVLPYKSLQSYFSNKANLFYYYHCSNKTNEITVQTSGSSYYRTVLQTIQLQIATQSDSMLLSNVVLRMR
jgi:hypothetical protein